MLRLEKGHRKAIAITLRPKNLKEWNREFWAIIGIVLAFHLFLWLTIQIETADDSSSENLSKSSVSLIASLQNIPSVKQGKVLRNGLPPPPETSPQLPEFSNIGIKRFSGYVPPSTAMNFFASMEEDYLLSEDQFSTPSPTITFSGPLATRKILHADIPNVKENELYLAIFEVRVDNKTGKIFWFQQQKTKLAQIHLKKAESILRTIQLNSIADEPITAGMVEILI